MGRPPKTYPKLTLAQAVLATFNTRSVCRNMNVLTRGLLMQNCGPWKAACTDERDQVLAELLAGGYIKRREDGLAGFRKVRDWVEPPTAAEIPDVIWTRALEAYCAQKPFVFRADEIGILEADLTRSADQSVKNPSKRLAESCV